ncbi:MAG: hypothetical protein DI538_10720 [Azospira oryzae]|nr:MAG: hypothetical protein DI538_10720 [Azospira oryzae]
MTSFASPAIHLKNRIASIDIARGCIMVVMALDHVRDYFHTDAQLFQPTDLTRTNAALFFTRFITHFCAPTFVLLAGTSIYLSLQRKTKSELARFLITRGLWLMLLDLIVMRAIFFFNFYYDATVLTVLWAFGLAMVFMAAFIWLPRLAVLGVGVVFIALQHFLPPVPALTGIGVFPLGPQTLFIISYPLLPWLGIMMTGYALGELYTSPISSPQRRQKLFVYGGVALLLFILLRFINLFGDPVAWTTQDTPLFTVLSFLNVSKYPASLLFVLMTVGVTLLLLALLEEVNPSQWKFVHVFGRVPLFYFLLHFLLAHVIALALYLIKTGKSWSELDLHFDKSLGGITSEGGYTLPWVYVAWIGVVVICYPVCRWYDQYKSTHTKWWLSYL